MEKLDTARSRKDGIRTFLISFGLFVGLFLLIDYMLAALCMSKATSIVGRQTWHYHELSRNPRQSASEKTAQFEVKKVSENENEYYLPEFDTYYYPNAWGKEGRILLKRRWRNFQYVTFGDRTVATLAYFAYYGDDPNLKPRYIQPTRAERYNWGNSWTIPLAGAVIWLAIVLTRRGRAKSSGDETPGGKTCA